MALSKDKHNKNRNNIKILKSKNETFATDFKIGNLI